MKSIFIKTTLTLSLLVMAMAPTYAFAGTNCEGNVSVPLNQQTVVKNLNSYIANNSWIKQNCSNFESLAKVDVANVNAAKSKNCPETIIRKLTEHKSTAATVATATPSKSTTSNTAEKAPANTVANTAEKATANTTEKATANTAANTAEKATANTAAVGSYEKQVADLVNKERAAAGLKPLTLSTEISKVAELKAEDMRDKNYFSHTSPTYGSPFDMMKQFGVQYSTAGENIAKGQQTPQSVMDAWMNSSGHKANILGANYGKIGVGYVTDSNGTTYWVQMFTN